MNGCNNREHEMQTVYHNALNKYVFMLVCVYIRVYILHLSFLLYCNGCVCILRKVE